ncbi:ergothioneine biosynthesis glutamate--cysteine ligase EgtA [Nocardia uniformis]|uniref:Glutamate--cysteine ligase EgtA n=1 Tax=Nocardia uniformis TaxID=53432 RepID=A0A849BTX7_9NOCA|nr:ergothioneine biosynthesis glutamate--cysteine ligase EgtA [Nocardia uniformis]NNH70072.1 ergothioneine biosynthesis glutamate--cysteine ligase EgtA [Nocardia uniformis]
MAVTASHTAPPGAVAPGSRTNRSPDAGFTSRAAAEAYVGGVCFKLGPPMLIGAELEWLTARGECSASRSRPDSTVLADALGPYAPQSISPDSPAVSLPGGSRVTLEPGGQIELSSAPFGTASQLCDRLRYDASLLRELLEFRGIRTISAAADPDREARRVLRLPRYRAMERSFSGIGPYGALMMCNTAAVQVSVDAGADADEVTARWTALYTFGPALLSAFACSPRLYGVPPGEWASQRMRTWLRLDNPRTRPPVHEWSDPITGYARWALDVPLLCVRSDGGDWAAPPGATFADWICGALDDEIGRRPSTVDLDYHLTTMFPPVRASGHLEVRYLDTQPGEGWTVPVHAVDALLSTPDVVAEATALTAYTAGRWSEAARHGLADPELRSAAVDLLELAAAHASTPEAAAELTAAALRCKRCLSPTEALESGGGA